MQKTLYRLVVQSPKKMRYLTTGDYYNTKAGWVVVSADLGNPDYNFLTLIHELIELYLTQRRGITEPEIKKFDEWFEREKSKGKLKKYLSPGRHPNAPYRKEHMFAVKIEKLLVKKLGVSRQLQWKTEDEVFEKIKRHLQV